MEKRGCAMTIVGAVAVAALAIAAGTAWSLRTIHHDVAASRAATEHEASALSPESIPATVVPMPAAPDELPLAGEEGVDADGFPAQRVDRVGLLAMLFEGKYAALEAAIAEAQRRFEADPRYEDWAIDAVGAFSDADPRVGAALRVWQRSRQESWQWLAASAERELAVAGRQRGGAFTAETSDARLRMANQTRMEAVALYRRALAAKPEAIGASTGLVWALMGTGQDDALRQAYDSAVTHCPSCVRARYAYFQARLPRWGGSLEELGRVVSDAQEVRPTNARLSNFDVTLSAYRCRLHVEQEGELPEDAACADAARRAFYGMHLYRPAQLALRRHDLERAQELVSRALTLPFSGVMTGTLGARVSVDMGRAEEAGERLLWVRRLDPTYLVARRLTTQVADALDARAQVLLTQDERTDALHLLELATWLDPERRRENARARAVSRGLDTSPEGIAALRAAVASDPDSFDAAQALDYALSTSSAWDEILGVWNRYLDAHPRDARAYRERAGTLHRMRRTREAFADLDHACNLGLMTACRIAQGARAAGR